jgi:hypothetical protein
MPVNLMLVCEGWHKETKRHMHPGNPCGKVWYGITGHEDIYETFLNGVLIYKPDPNSDVGIVLMISDLINPLEGTFDLSECGEAGKYLVISTGYRKGINPDNKGKTEIWIAPLFLIKKKLSTTAKHFSRIQWSKGVAPVGVFFTCAHQPIEYMDCCTSQDLNFISENALFIIWTKARPGLPDMGMGGNAEQVWMRSESRGFNVRFDMDKKTLIEVIDGYPKVNASTPGIT